MAHLNWRSRPLWIAVALCSSVVGYPGHAAPPGAPLPDKVRVAFGDMIEAAEKRDCSTAAKWGEPIAKGEIDVTPGEIRAASYNILAACHYDAKQFEKAYAYALSGTRVAESGVELWQLRLGIELDGKRHEAAATTLLDMRQGHGAALNATPVDWIWHVLRELKMEGKAEARLRLLRLLGSNGYAPDQMFGDNDGFQLSLARDLTRAGDRAGAHAALADLEAPASIVAAILEPDLRDGLTNRDVRLATENALLRQRDIAARFPDKLKPTVEAATHLQQLGRHGEALTLLRSVADRVSDPQSFSDGAEYANWWWDALASTYDALGRYDEMVDAYRKGSAIQETESGNISQVINLALAQGRFGRFEDSLETLKLGKPDGAGTTPYGRMLYRGARACGLSRLGRKPEAAADVAYVEAHEADAPTALLDLKLCLGDLDGAARRLIAQLANPEQRSNALMELSEFNQPGTKPRGPIEDALEQLKARADVQAAIHATGGSTRFNIEREGF